MQSFPLSLTMKSLFPTHISRAEENSAASGVFSSWHLFRNWKSSHLKIFFPSHWSRYRCPFFLPTRVSGPHITASFPSQIKLFPIPNMAASITQQAIKLEEKSKYCLKRTSAASKLTRFMAKFDPQSSFLDTRCHKYNRAPAFWPGAVIIDRNSSVFPPPIIDKKWFNQYSSNIRSIFLRHFVPYFSESAHIHISNSNFVSWGRCLHSNYLRSTLIPEDFFINQCDNNNGNSRLILGRALYRLIMTMTMIDSDDEKGRLILGGALWEVENLSAHLQIIVLAKRAWVGRCK